MIQLKNQKITGQSGRQQNQPKQGCAVMGWPRGKQE
jgi:hypothetical protein